MGDAQSRMEREKAELDDFRKQIKDSPDLRVNKTIVMFTGVSSSDNLRQHYEKRKMEAGQFAAGMIKSLLEILGDLTPVPALAGLGSMAISIYIDSFFPSPPEESMKDALRSVFAEEKASEVWDQIDECLKRCMMHIHNDYELATDITRIEVQLSAAPTKLKNSMVRDGHMSSQALKAWVNGAAFHIQMLIHLVRLGGTQTCDPVESLLSTYLRDLRMLFQEHREMIRAKCRDLRAPSRLIDEESNVYRIAHASHDKYFDVYYNQRYMRQMCDIERYFSDVKENLQTLVDQRGYLKVD
ncbi:uncharacterized protein LOC118494116 [Sander lucioperca]|uniref:uncharacterized protein LOC118494116 n=1 Tax=Sander lucioperca TaxID=283035 RepID=UPI0016537967|nr:uncharacterized protein LOC118494116 [Sander lucioperca]